MKSKTPLIVIGVVLVGVFFAYNILGPNKTGVQLASPTEFSELVKKGSRYREQNNEVVITPDNQDLGTVIYGDVPTTSFTLTNFTPLPTKITRVSTSCGCTSAEVEQEELGAYESTTVKVSFDPAVHDDGTDLGELTRTIYINTDNPNFPKLTSTITANVVKR